MKVKFALHGCDDSTFIEMEMTGNEYRTLQRISEASHEVSSYGCMPTLDIEDVEDY